MPRLGLAALAFLAVTTSAKAFETVAVISGIVTARDGDDVMFGRVPVRLQGIAAPEDSRSSQEPGGADASEHLRNMIDGRFVVCHLDGTTAGQSGRSAGVCYLGLVEINRRQVEAGFARDCPTYSAGRYADAEEGARVSGRDLSAIYALPGYCVE
jgi:micrococcal nuclease